MTPAIIFDTEYLSIEGSMQRFWTGTGDPDPIVVQIGAVKVDLDDGCAVLASRKINIRPVGRKGEPLHISEYLERLTGITDAELARSGVTLARALRELDALSDGGSLWSWGKDEIFMIGVSCLINGIAPLIEARRFGNCKDLMVSAGMSAARIAETTSGQLAGVFGLGAGGRRQHDALDDAMSLTVTIRHLFTTGALSRQDFRI